MKQRNLTKKLTVNKKTISNLTDNSMSNVKGGAFPSKAVTGCPQCPLPNPSIDNDCYTLLATQCNDGTCWGGCTSNFSCV